MSIFSKEYLQSTPTADLRIRLLDYQTHDGQYKELLREIVGREERANKRQLLIGVWTLIAAGLALVVGGVALLNDFHLLSWFR